MNIANAKILSSSIAILFTSCFSSAQSLTGNYDFSDGLVSISADTSIFASSNTPNAIPFVDTTKHGLTTGALISNGNFTGNGTLEGAYAWNNTSAYLADGASGNVSFDFMADSGGAFNTGDRYGLVYVGEQQTGASFSSPSFFMGVQCGVTTGSSSASWDLIIDNGTTVTTLASIGSFLALEEAWVGVTFDYSVTGNIVNVTHTLDGFYQNNTNGNVHNNLGTFGTLSGTNSTNVTANLINDDTTYFGLYTKSLEDGGTANSSVDNLAFVLNSGTVPEPQSTVLFVFSLTILSLRRIR